MLTCPGCLGVDFLNDPEDGPNPVEVWDLPMLEAGATLGLK